jgi:hypothetical protein
LRQKSKEKTEISENKKSGKKHKNKIKKQKRKNE